MLSTARCSPYDLVRPSTRIITGDSLMDGYLRAKVTVASSSLFPRISGEHTQRGQEPNVHRRFHGAELLLQRAQRNIQDGPQRRRDRDAALLEARAHRRLDTQASLRLQAPL